MGWLIPFKRICVFVVNREKNAKMNKIKEAPIYVENPKSRKKTTESDNFHYITDEFLQWGGVFLRD